MILVFGGAFQGKTDYIKKRFGLRDEDIFDFRGREIEEMPMDLIEEPRALNGLEALVLYFAKKDFSAADWLREVMPVLRDKVLVMDDISQGIVPMDPVLRKWREECGRALSYLGSEADEVVRVFCGLAEVIRKPEEAEGAAEDASAAEESDGAAVDAGARDAGAERNFSENALSPGEETDAEESAESAPATRLKGQLILIRHGLTEGNQKRWFYGGVDIPLLPEGKERLQRFVNAGVYPPVPEDASFFTTGMIRTRETLEIIYGEKSYEEIPDLREMSFGDFECKPWDDLKDDPAFITWMNDPEGDFELPGGGESRSGFYKRIDQGMVRLVGEHWLNEWAHRASGAPAVTVCVCHGGSISRMMHNFFPGLHENMWGWMMDPGLGYIVDFEENRPVRWKKLEAPQEAN